HPQALAQCRGWLMRNYPLLPLDAAASNSEAARQASQDPTVAAIAGDYAAHAWDLQAVASGIQDDPQNRTRFLAVGRLETLPTGDDQTSIILAVPNRAGAVYSMLAPLAGNGVSMTRFESRPARTGQWEYYFYVDMLGHRNDPKVAKALIDLKKEGAFFKKLGSYPRQEGVAMHEPRQAADSAALPVLAVVGVGLIGGSFAAALRRAGAVGRVLGVGRNRKSLQHAIELGLIDAEATLQVAAEQADIIFLSLPVGSTQAALETMLPHLRH